jgi:hypothetical protein
MLLTGPKLEEMKKRLIEWWLTNRRMLIDRLEEGFPYGSIQLSTEEQIQKFVSMTPQDWNDLIGRLMTRYRGEPNQGQLVRADLEKYQKRMTSLMQGRP